MTQTPAPEQPSPNQKRQYPELKLSTALRELLEYSQRSEHGITLGDIIDRTGEKSFSVLLAFLCLPFLVIPIPGASVPFGIALMFLGVQMMLRWDRPWLPKFLCRRRLPKKSTEAVLRGVTKFFRPLEKIIRPRLLFMQSHVAYVIVGLILVIDAFLLSLPLPIPYTNTPPAWAILIKVLGSTEDDGLLLIIGLILSAIMICVAVYAGVMSFDAIMMFFHPAASTAPATQ